MSEIIQVMTYDQWEERHKQVQKRARRKRKKELQKMQQYYLRQKIYGFMILVFGLLVGCIANLLTWDNLFFLGVIIVVSGLYVMITRQMLIVNRYFIELHS